MSRALITINSTSDRERATKWVGQAPTGTRIEFKQAKRSDDQNAKLWAMLTEVAAQVPWHGIKLTTDDWKFIFIDALKRELRVVPNIDGTGFVNLGRSSSDLSKSEMSDLIELIHAFGAGHGVVFRDTDSNSSQAQASPSTTETSAPAAEDSLLPDAAGQQSQGSSRAEHADDESGRAEADASPSGLPAGWEITYAAALRRAQKIDSLPKYATEYWKQYGGWEKIKLTDARETAVAIYDAFHNNFGRKDQIEAALRELI